MGGQMQFTKKAILTKLVLFLSSLAKSYCRNKPSPRRRGIFEKSDIPWPLSVMPVRKTNAGLRFCLDNTKVTEVTKDYFAVPSTEGTHVLAKWFSMLIM
jgi:hypothetical protein